MNFVTTKKTIPALLLICLAITGCFPGRKTVTVWKNSHAFPGKYSNIMIAAIVNISDTTLRAKVENGFKDVLQSKGYDALSSLKIFGMNGLRDLGQEDTYRILCDKGIDAVMTIALITPEQRPKNSRLSLTDPVEFYYQRIWHFKEQRQRFTAAYFDSSNSYSWEMILFDLSTLQPHSIVQTKTYTQGITESLYHEFWKDIIARLIRDRYLEKRKAIPAAAQEIRKAF